MGKTKKRREIDYYTVDVCKSPRRKCHCSLDYDIQFLYVYKGYTFLCRLIVVVDVVQGSARRKNNVLWNLIFSKGGST